MNAAFADDSTLGRRSRTTHAPMSPWVLACALALASSLSSGCEFFRELDSVEDADEAADGDGTATDGEEGPCTIEDDVCRSQDELDSCDFDSGDLSSWNCAAMCGTSLNFTCLDAGGGVHGCFCVVPGKHNTYGCADLEACLGSCADVFGACGDACFAKATATSIRLYGALVHCAETECRETCLAQPSSCSSCVQTIKSGLVGSCGVERTVCDQDPNDEPSWP